MYQITCNQTIPSVITMRDNSSSMLMGCICSQPVLQYKSQDDFSGQFFRIFEIIILCFVVAICDLVHDVETIVHPKVSYVLTAFGNHF